MIYSSVSIKQVIARVIRNTRIKDSSYIQDMTEWIPEAMGYMRTTYELSYSWKDVKISFHKGILPCGLISIEAVEYNGQRLKTSSTVKHYATGHDLRYNPGADNEEANLFLTSIGVQDLEGYGQPGNFLYKSEPVPFNTSLNGVKTCDISPSDFYTVEMNCITTSMADATVRLHYKSQPMDDEGFPLIPDNENYKEALYYYVRAKMIGCGYHDTVFREDVLMNRFEGHAARAISEIRYPTPDMMQVQVDALVRFIPPTNYWENYFRTDSPEQIQY